MKTLLLLSALMLAMFSNAQIDDTGYIKKHAIPIGSKLGMSDRAYTALHNYRIILIGEAHGTAESAEFVEEITEAFLKHGQEVIVGMEIPADQMTGFATGRNEDSLAASTFFNLAKEWGTKGDGRASEAWAQLLISLAPTKVYFGFFDGIAKQAAAQNYNRDSIMFENINATLKQYPNAVFIGLCGNAHNMLHPIIDNPMAWYLQNASNTCLKDTSQLLCLNHVFNTGTMYCNIGKGLEIVEYKYGVAGNFNTAENYDNYLLLGYGNNNYSGIFYTKTVNASFVWLRGK